MRTMALIACSLLALGFVSFAPSAAATNLFCTSLTAGWSCPGIVCVDIDRDGHPEYEECVATQCGIAGCCGAVCPPPPAAPTVCKETKVGATPAYVTLEYGASAGCVGASYTTCRLSYYPGEPNTPVWVCTTKTLV